MSVKSGTPLITVSAKNMVNGDPSVAAEVEYESALRRYERAEKPCGRSVNFAEEFEQVRLRYEKARMPSPRLSPRRSDGFVANRRLCEKGVRQKGDYVEIGQPLAVVTRDKRLQLRAEVSEKYADRLPTLTGANFNPPTAIPYINCPI